MTTGASCGTPSCLRISGRATAGFLNCPMSMPLRMRRTLSGIKSPRLRPRSIFACDTAIKNDVIVAAQALKQYIEPSNRCRLVVVKSVAVDGVDDDGHTRGPCRKAAQYARFGAVRVHDDRRRRRPGFDMLQEFFLFAEMLLDPAGAALRGSDRKPDESAWMPAHHQKARRRGRPEGVPQIRLRSGSER